MLIDWESKKEYIKIPLAFLIDLREKVKSLEKNLSESRSREARLSMEIEKIEMLEKALKSLKQTNIRLEEREKELVLEIGSLTLRNFDLQEELKKIKETL